MSQFPFTDERERVGKRFKAFAASFGTDVAAEKTEDPDECVARLTREFRATPPLPLSDRARAAMGLEPAPREIPETWDADSMNF